MLVEPNLPAYVNYCGPASSRVLISAWTSNVPSLDTLAAQEGTRPSRGTYPKSMVDPINNAIGHDYYELTHAATQGELSDIIGRSILRDGHPLIVGVRTRPPSSAVPSLNGWHRRVSHYIMVYGFDFRRPDVGYVTYFEIASPLAGTTAAGKNRIAYNDFWELAAMFDVQIAGPAKAGRMVRRM